MKTQSSPISSNEKKSKPNNEQKNILKKRTLAQMRSPSPKNNDTSSGNVKENSEKLLGVPSTSVAQKEFQSPSNYQYNNKSSTPAKNTSSKNIFFENDRQNQGEQSLLLKFHTPSPQSHKKDACETQLFKLFLKPTETIKGVTKHSPIVAVRAPLEGRVGEKEIQSSNSDDESHQSLLCQENFQAAVIKKQKQVNIPGAKTAGEKIFLEDEEEGLAEDEHYDNEENSDSDFLTIQKRPSNPNGFQSNPFNCHRTPKASVFYNENLLPKHLRVSDKENIMSADNNASNKKANSGIQNSPSKKPKVKEVNNNHNFFLTQGSENRPQCNCKKSKCLKLYCDCFAAGELCKNCNCIDCHNVEDKKEVRYRTMLSTLERNPQAFKPKIFSNQTSAPQESTESKCSGGKSQVRHSKGCNCKKSGCQKKYCECFQAGVMCSEFCKCLDCLNIEEDLRKVREERANRYSFIQRQKLIPVGLCERDGLIFGGNRMKPEGGKYVVFRVEDGENLDDDEDSPFRNLFRDGKIKKLKIDQEN